MKLNRKIIVVGLVTILCLGSSVSDTASNVKAVTTEKKQKVITPFADEEILQFGNRRFAELLVEQLKRFGARPDLTVDNITINEVLASPIDGMGGFQFDWSEEKEKILSEGERANLRGFEKIGCRTDTSFIFNNVDNDFKVDVTSFRESSIFCWVAYINYNNSNSSEAFDWEKVTNTWRLDEMFGKDAIKGSPRAWIMGGMEWNQDIMVNLVKKELTKENHQNFEIFLADFFSADFEVDNQEDFTEFARLELLEKLMNSVTFIDEKGNELVYKISVVGSGKESKFVFELESGEYQGGTYTPNSGQLPTPQADWTNADFAQSYFFSLYAGGMGLDSDIPDGRYEFQGYGYFVLDMADEDVDPEIPDITDPENPDITDPEKPVDPENPDITNPESPKDSTDSENSDEENSVKETSEKEKDLPQAGLNQTAVVVSLLLGTTGILAKGLVSLRKRD